MQNVPITLKCLGVVQANFAHVQDFTLHTHFLQTLQAIPRPGMSRFQTLYLDKMISEEERRLETLTFAEN